MVRKPRPPLSPIRSLPSEQAAKRRLARKLRFKNEAAFDRWLTRSRALPVDDIRHLREGIADDDFVQLNRIRDAEKKFRTPAARLLERKRILVDDADTKNHMSAFAFLDRYLEQIKALLRDPKTTDYRKRQLRRMQRDLQHQIKYTGDLGEARQFDLFGKYQGKDLGV